MKRLTFAGIVALPTEADFANIDRLVEQIRPILAGHHPAAQGAALADLLAIWLAGHEAAEETPQLREHMLQEHIRHVRALVPINAKILGTTP